MKNNTLSKSLTIFTDGGSRGNPGPAAYGFVVFDAANNELSHGSQFLGIATNNQAEYQGVLGALQYIDKSTNFSDTNNTLRLSSGQANNILNIQFYLDSELIVKQMNGEYKIKNDDLKVIYWQIRELIMKLGGKVSFHHIPREKNKLADKLVNEELDKQCRK